MRLGLHNFHPPCIARSQAINHRHLKFAQEWSSPRTDGFPKALPTLLPHTAWFHSHAPSQCWDDTSVLGRLVTWLTLPAQIWGPNSASDIYSQVQSYWKIKDTPQCLRLWQTVIVLLNWCWCLLSKGKPSIQEWLLSICSTSLECLSQEERTDGCS